MEEPGMPCDYKTAQAMCVLLELENQQDNPEKKALIIKHQCELSNLDDAGHTWEKILEIGSEDMLKHVLEGIKMGKTPKGIWPNAWRRCIKCELEAKYILQ